MAALYLSSKGIATCWQGSLTVTRENDFPESLPYVSALAFGYSDEAFRSSADEFDRKPLNKLAFGKYQDYLSIVEAGRLAPSSITVSPVFSLPTKRGAYTSTGNRTLRTTGY
jgi:hypothetical protein